MTYRELDTVVLLRDIPEHGLKAGDLGTAVTVFVDGTITVEFVRASGATQALVDLSPDVVRPSRDDDVAAVRPR